VGLKPIPGPLQLKDLPVLGGISAKKKSWEVSRGILREEKDNLMIDGDGGTYWLTSKEPLPENFQLVIPCQIEFLKGKQAIQKSQESILRMLSVRFGTEETETGEVQPKRADLTYPPLGEVTVNRVFFSPDGRHLLLECQGGGVRSLRRVGLNLTAAEEARLPK
jgi:hypothetical protein